MPFYEYRCEHCGNEFSAMLSMSRRDEEEKNLACPACGQVEPRRLLSTFCTSSGDSHGAGSTPPCASGGG
jgi:putative FmdB family regulatory protein